MNQLARFVEGVGREKNLARAEWARTALRPTLILCISRAKVNARLTEREIAVSIFMDRTG
jgi:hypothetical protein